VPFKCHRSHARLAADEFVGCTENLLEAAELAGLAAVIESYERQGWPTGEASFFQAKRQLERLGKVMFLTVGGNHAAALDPQCTISR
jgi:hypothetical protein